MNDEHRRSKRKQSEERRRFLGFLGGTGLLGLALPLVPGKEAPKELSLKEADFYRKHDLAG